MSDARVWWYRSGGIPGARAASNKALSPDEASSRGVFFQCWIGGGQLVHTENCTACSASASLLWCPENSVPDNLVPDNSVPDSSVPGQFGTMTIRYWTIFNYLTTYHFLWYKVIFACSVLAYISVTYLVLDRILERSWPMFERRIPYC